MRITPKTFQQPRFKHDCTACAYLGRHLSFDLYWCDQNGMLPTAIARYGNNGPDYLSGLDGHVVPLHPLWVAKRIAQEWGLRVKREAQR